MLGINVILSLFLTYANAQTPIMVDQFLGLDDTDPSASLPIGQAQSALNVESSLNGNALLKREGYTRIASLTISTSQPTGAYSFIDPNGNKQDVVCHDHSCSKSTNNAAFSVFLSTAGGACLPKQWSFAQITGYLYAANDCHDRLWRYDGTTRADLDTNSPLGSILEATKDRLVVSGVAASPNTVYYSQSGTYTNFLIGVNSADPYTDAVGSTGDQVRGLKYALGRLYVFKTNSIVTCILGDQYTSKCFPVSNIIGTSDPNAIVEVPGMLMFKGSDKNFWAMDENGLIPLSKKISVLISSQTAGFSQSNTQTSQSDWNAGIQFPSSTWNTSFVNGSILPSSSTYVDSISTASLLVRLSTGDSAGALTISSNVFQDNFRDNDFTANPAWTPGAYSWSVTNYISDSVCPALNYCLAAGNGDNQIYSPSIISSGSWRFTSYQNGGSKQFTFKFISQGTSFLGDQGYGVESNSSGASTLYNLKKYPAGTTLCSVTDSALTDNTTQLWRILRNNQGNFEVDLRTATDVLSSSCTATDTAYSSSTYILIDSGSGGQDFTNIYAYQYKSSATYFSGIFDTTFSTTIGGPIAVSSSVPNGTNIVFQTRSGTVNPPDATWGAWSTVSNGGRIGETNRYWQYLSSFTTTIATTTPSQTSATLLAATTGQYVTQCIQPGSGITSWGQATCSQTLGGQGSVIFYATSAATCASLPAGQPSTWQTSITNNATLTIATNTAVAIGFRSLLGSATDQAQIDACTLYWINGTAAPPSWGTYDPIRNAAYWTTAINNSGTGNRVLKYDLNLNQWYPFGLNAGVIYRNQTGLYFGDSTGGYWNLYGGVTSDNGSAINAYWISKDFGNVGNPFVDNNFNRVSLVAKNQGSGNMTVGYSMNNGSTGTYTVSLATGTSVRYVHANYNLPLLSPYQFVNINLGNNSSTPYEIDGLMIEYTSKPWKPGNP